MENLLRVLTASPRVHIGNVTKNCDEIKSIYKEYADKADIILMPELSLTGYTCADLFENRNLLDNTVSGLMALTKFTESFGENGSALVVGAPIEVSGELYNCAAFIQNGKIIAVVPKTYLPNYGEFYEKRWFSAREYDFENIEIGDMTVPFGNNLIIELGQKGKSVKIGIEICEDAWTPIPPSRILAINGAEIILNLSASNEVIGKEQYRRNLVGNISSTCLCGYAYASAGIYESTSDIVFSGHNLMYENGKLLGEIKPFESGILIRDFSLTKIRHDRIANKSFADCKGMFNGRNFVKIICNKKLMQKNEILAKVSMTPFVPSKNRLERCTSIFNMQVAGLQRRLEATKSKCVVIGVSGGLDSTLALLVAAQAVRNLNLPSKTVVGITMPGFGTTKRTKSNSITLMEKLGCDIREISIVKATRQHFEDIGHDESIHDITYENCQARERTQVLMDVANKEGGFVIGTGDLSELALGWCTYNGDHMSMYAVNVSIPKTLVRYLTAYEAQHSEGVLKTVLLDVLDTPVSPELLPPDKNGEIAQKTEDVVGPYELHDFFLYYLVRFGFEPNKIYYLAKKSFAGKYDNATIKKWLTTFVRRFFTQQFKRSCLPDGPKVGSVTLSPRSDWRMPSDACVNLWLENLEED